MVANGRNSRDYLAKKWLQLRIALAYLMVISAGSALLAAALVPRLSRALRSEMYRGHSTVANTWDLLLPHVIPANVIAASAVLVLAGVVTLVVLSSVHRSALRIARDLREAQAGGDPGRWELLRRPRELRHLQKRLAEGIEHHRRHLAELDGICAEILERTGEAGAEGGARRDLRTLHVLCERLRSHARRIRTE